MLACLLGGCGLYGEGGFFDNGTLSRERFIEKADEECAGLNDGLGPDVRELLSVGAVASRAADVADELHDGLDDLIRDLDELKGPAKLERARDELTDAFDAAATALDDVKKSLDDGDRTAADDHLATVRQHFADADKATQTVGLQVCGAPEPSP
jgi:ABC-type transporter Mla subunit MlaD